MSKPICPECRIEMEGGYLHDFTDSSHKQAVWVEGPPEPSRLRGLDIRNRRSIGLYAWRCSRCALVRLYAPD